MYPGARYRTDGPYSGEEFFEEQLEPRYLQARARGEKLTVILDGTNGFASSFLNEAFGRLAKAHGKQEVLETIQLVSVEIPKYIRKVEQAIDERG